MRDLLDRLYGGTTTLHGAAGDAPRTNFGADGPNVLPDRQLTAATAVPDLFLPFGWSGLAALSR
jgi:hypothetical protein